jgi:hypothetical protein
LRPVGFIADDITGATDLASALTARGLDTRLAFGSARLYLLLEGRSHAYLGEEAVADLHRRFPPTA